MLEELRDLGRIFIMPISTSDGSQFYVNSKVLSD